MEKYSAYLRDVQDRPFTPEIRQELQSKGQIIRWLQQGLESGYYDS